MPEEERLNWIEVLVDVNDEGHSTDPPTYACVVCGVVSQRSEVWGELCPICEIARQAAINLPEKEA